MALLPPDAANYTICTAYTMVKVVTEYIVWASAVGALIMFIIGAMMYITSAVGGSDKAQKGKTTLMWAIIGLTVVLLSNVIIRQVLNLLQPTDNITGTPQCQTPKEIKQKLDLAEAKLAKEQAAEQAVVDEAEKAKQTSEEAKTKASQDKANGQGQAKPAPNFKPYDYNFAGKMLKVVGEVTNNELASKIALKTGSVAGGNEPLPMIEIISTLSNEDVIKHIPKDYQLSNNSLLGRYYGNKTYVSVTYNNETSNANISDTPGGESNSGFLFSGPNMGFTKYQRFSPQFKLSATKITYRFYYVVRTDPSDASDDKVILLATVTKPGAN